MASLPTYIDALWSRQRKIARKLGAEIGSSEKTLRVFNKSLVVLLAVVVKTLVDKGVVTDAELLAVLDAARDADHQGEPSTPPPAEP